MEKSYIVIWITICWYLQVYAEEQVKLDFHPLPTHDPYFRCVQDKYAYGNLQPQLTHNAALAVHRDNFG